MIRDDARAAAVVRDHTVIYTEHKEHLDLVQSGPRDIAHDHHIQCPGDPAERKLGKTHGKKLMEFIYPHLLLCHQG